MQQAPVLGSPMSELGESVGHWREREKVPLPAPEGPERGSHREGSWDHGLCLMLFACLLVRVVVGVRVPLLSPSVLSTAASKGGLLPGKQDMYPEMCLSCFC